MEQTGKNPTAANGNPGFQHFDQLLPPRRMHLPGCCCVGTSTRQVKSLEKTVKSRDENPLGSKQ